MKAIMVMFDSLNRAMLESYGCTGTRTPNFKRLAQRATQFENCYVGSMPCMPARRELHTGDELYDFPGAEVRAIASARFGLENYSGEGLACYDSERDEYTLYGRGAAVVYELLEADGPEDGALRVTARVYADSACIVPERTLLYTFRVSEPDGCEIVSCEELF